jgi:Electron transfer DM13
MRRRTWIVVAVVLGGIGWYLFRPELLFVNQRVNEPLPAGTSEVTEAPVMPTISVQGAGTAGKAAEPVLTGRFHSVAHETKGRATVHQLPGGSRILRLTQFETSNGPDVRVYLVAAADATDDETVTKAGFVELGRLKGNQGDQNYDVPADLDLAKYRAATIWCKRFSVNFGTAPLTPAS